MVNGSPFRQKIYQVIFESDTPAGKRFDLILLVSILLSVLVVMLDSVASVNKQYGEFLYWAEWFFTILFSVEYVFRLYSIDSPRHYATSFYGIIDFLAICPTYLSLFIPGAQYLLVIRVLRVLRIFRILKIVQYVSEANVLMLALRQSRHKIAVFFLTMVTLVIILGSFMYLIEMGQDSGFTSIPQSVYWAVVTITTVGYGDISPVSPLGQTVAGLIMFLGYSIIAIPTGIFSMEITRARKMSLSTRVCSHCSAEGHDDDAEFCKACGTKLD